VFCACVLCVCVLVFDYHWDDSVQKVNVYFVSNLIPEIVISLNTITFKSILYKKLLFLSGFCLICFSNFVKTVKICGACHEKFCELAGLAGWLALRVRTYVLYWRWVNKRTVNCELALNSLSIETHHQNFQNQYKEGREVTNPRTAVVESWNAEQSWNAEPITKRRPPRTLPRSHQPSLRVLVFL
jgi:hypothetical protein